MAAGMFKRRLVVDVHMLAARFELPFDRDG